MKCYPHGWQAHNLLISALADPSRSPDAVTKGSVPMDSESALTTDERLYMSILTCYTGMMQLTLLSYASEGSLKPMFLNHIPRPPPDWQFCGKVRTVTLPDWFDMQVIFNFNAFHSLILTEMDSGDSAMTTIHAGHSPLVL